jgi:hypothetical protein
MCQAPDGGAHSFSGNRTGLQVGRLDAYMVTASVPGRDRKMQGIHEVSTLNEVDTMLTGRLRPCKVGGLDVYEWFTGPRGSACQRFHPAIS